MRVCYWCGEETPVIPGAPWGTVTRSGALLVQEGPDGGDIALCAACLPEVQAILQAHAWSEEHHHA
jgi:hypothetical protein